LPSESQAQALSDYLYSIGITNQIEEGPDAGGGADFQTGAQTADGPSVWQVWVHSEEHLDRARGILTDYLANPDAPLFRRAAATAKRKRQEEERDLREYKKRMFTKENILPRYEGMGRLTIALIVASAAVTLVSRLGRDLEVVRHLLISEYLHAGLAEVARGQIWRLVTPIFVHFGVLHILFNMLWLKDLGGMIENRQSPRTLAVLVAAIAVASNVGQFIASGPVFGGMSGVVYGLLGYAWLRGKYDPASGLYVHRQTVVMMVIWFFVCLTGIVGNIANTAHGVGFAVGLVWGLASAKIATATRRRGPFI
jgi:GlpG protein